MKTLNEERSEESVVIDGLEVANGTKFISDGKWIRLPKTYSKEKLSIGYGSFTSKQLQKQTYLDKIQGEICLGKNLNIRILIGANCLEVLEPVKVRNSKNGGPFTFKTVLGWCIVGPVKSSQVKRKFCCNRTAVMEAGTNEIAKHHFQKRNSIAETDIKQIVSKMYGPDFKEAKLGKRLLLDAEEISFEDNKILEIIDKETKFVDEHYQVPLPFRNANVTFPNNRHYAMTRLRQLEKRFERNQSFFSN